MLSHRIYYQLKPFIPRTLQIFLRRKIALRKRDLCRHVWPIDEKAAKPPDRWCGWPDQKRFALVITHDVEGCKGVESCSELAKLDESYGFRSSFNFVAEDCEVSSGLLHYLNGHKFEVGVHGLHHDGNLFGSKRQFGEQTIRINTYLKEWDSVGFRAPCMYHNLDWIHALNIEYDSSTFDTDPFEPQPDGVGTIFPFWVPRNSQLLTRNLEPGTGLRSGYVELPYTLPQDFTLFILMREKTIDIWKKKLRWIAQHGGMALLITHPDYMNGTKKKCGIEEYPMEFYREFLDYIESKYKSQYWNPLPRGMARFWKEKIVSPLLSTNSSRF